MLHLFGSEQLFISLIAGILISFILGLSGTMVVHSGVSFFSDALGHCTFTGIALGQLIGIKNYEISSILFAVLFSLIISYLIEKEKSSADTIISIFSSAGLSLGIFILSFCGGISDYSDFLIGDIFSVTKTEILGILLLLIFVVLFWIVFFNKFLISSLNKDLAVIKLVNFKFYKAIFMLVIAVVVSVAIRWVGILLINSLLTLPSVAARNISKSMKQYVMISSVFSIISGVFGFVISYFAGSSSAPSIVLFASVLYIVSHLISMRYNVPKICRKGYDD